MPYTSPQRSAVILRWPLNHEAILEIHPDRVASDTTVGIVALRLIELGGHLTGWQPNFYDLPAVARFKFANPHERNLFLAQALELPGVRESTTSGD
jgi:hypothetical protein